MNSKEFAVKLATYYKEPLVVDGKPNIKLTFLEKWLNENDFDLSAVFDEIILKYVPTSISPFPLIPHIRDIIEIDPKDEASVVASSIIEALSRGTTANLSSVALEVIEREGGWAFLSSVVMADDITTWQAQLRDLARGMIKRKDISKLQIDNNVAIEIIRKLAETKKLEV